MLTPILHSVSYAGVWPGQARLSLYEFLDKAAALGFPAVMLMAKRPHASLLDFDSGERDKLRTALRERGLRCAVLAGYNNFSADAGHGDIPQREIQIHYVTALARLAHDLQAPLVRIFTAYEHPQAPYPVLWQAVVDALGECARRAAPYGVTLAVQNHHDLAAGYEAMFDLLQAVGEPNCRAAFDAWAPFLQGADLEAAARKLAPLTCHTTIADYQLRPRYHYRPEVVNYEPRTPWVQAVPPGEGLIDYRAFLRALREGGYQGGVAYEMCSPLLGGGDVRNLDRCAGRFLDFLKTV